MNAARLIGNGPDLAVSPPVAKPRRATLGGRGAAVVRVVNLGNSPVAGATTVVLVLSGDEVLNAGDRTTASLALGADLAPRRRKAVRFRFDYPADLPAGVYFFIAVATPAESDVNASNDAAAGAAPVEVAAA